MQVIFARFVTYNFSIYNGCLTVMITAYQIKFHARQHMWYISFDFRYSNERRLLFNSIENLIRTGLNRLLIKYLSPQDASVLNSKYNVYRLFPAYFAKIIIYGT